MTPKNKSWKLIQFVFTMLLATVAAPALADATSTVGGGGGGGGCYSSASRAQIAVTIDNYKDARPASGIKEADIVYEFPVEGGITRLLAIYNPDNNIASSAKIGPIRSARPFIARIASGHQAIYAHAGGSPLALQGLNNNEYLVYNLDALSASGSPYFWRDENREMPYNLYTSFGLLRDFAYNSPASCASVARTWIFSNTPALASMYALSLVKVDFGNTDYNTAWAYNSSEHVYYRQIYQNGRYQNYFDADGRAVTAVNLAIQYAFTNPLKETMLIGGKAFLCQEGRCLNGTWKKSSLNEIVKFYKPNNEEFEFISGNLWISITNNRYAHDIALSPGWNIVSTPRLLGNHQFSVPEVVDNFNIYVLDPLKAAGWSTMGDLGQTEFTPLYGYFINNKTGQEQTLTLNYPTEVEPGNRLFARELNAGWNVVGVADPGYALRQKESNSRDTNNVQKVLTSLSDSIDTIIDFTANQFDNSLVKVSEQYNAKTWSDAAQINDFRETKAYALYLRAKDIYHGFQNIDPIKIYDPVAVFSKNSYDQWKYYYNNAKNVLLMDFTVATGHPIEVALNDMTINISGYSLNNADIRNLKLVCGNEVKLLAPYPIVGDNNISGTFFLDAGPAECRLTIDLTNASAGYKIIRARVKNCNDTAKWKIIGNNMAPYEYPNSIAGYNINVYGY